MRYTVHVYTPKNEFAQFLLGYREASYAVEAAFDHLSTRPGYRAEVHARTRLGEPANLVATIDSKGVINYAEV